MSVTMNGSAPMGLERTAGLLREIPLLAGLPGTLLRDVASHARHVRVAAGELVMREGAAGDGLYLLVAGEVEVTRRSGDQDVSLAVYGSGAVLGEMALIGRGPRSASIRALQQSDLLILEPADFETLLERSPATSAVLLRTVLARLRGTEATLVQHANLASLGTLAAGLAHELNNPAAALLRGLPQLQAALAELDRCAAWLGEIGLSSRVRSRVERVARADVEPVGARRAGMELLVAEDRLLDWLQASGAEYAVRVAPPLAAAAWTPERLEALLDGLEETQIPPVLHWLAACCNAASLIEELTVSAAAISDLVAAVKAHSALGQPSIREQDVVEGIEAALLILRGRLRDGITVIREFAPDLPRVEAYGAELNHVWLNLIENAIDAMQGHGVLELRVSLSAAGITIQVTDDGLGIPPDVQPRIFDPFFTTKPLEAGSGLGLHIVYNAVRKHRGTIQVHSRPRRTTFSVVLPLRMGSEQR